MVFLRRKGNFKLDATLTWCQIHRVVFVLKTSTVFSKNETVSQSTSFSCLKTRTVQALQLSPPKLWLCRPLEDKWAITLERRREKASVVCVKVFILSLKELRPFEPCQFTSLTELWFKYECPRTLSESKQLKWWANVVFFFCFSFFHSFSFLWILFLSSL